VESKVEEVVQSWRIGAFLKCGIFDKVTPAESEAPPTLVPKATLKLVALINFCCTQANFRIFFNDKRLFATNKSSLLLNNETLSPTKLLGCHYKYVDNFIK
jgi:hypothetical protein